jgi:hypothetical protein
MYDAMHMNSDHQPFPPFRTTWRSGPGPGHVGGDRPAHRQRAGDHGAPGDRLKAGELWQGSGLVFTTTVETMLDQHNVRREFRQITKAAGLGRNELAALG